MPNIELVRVIFIYYKVFKFHVPGSIPFSLIWQNEMQKHGITETHADSDEYSCILQKCIYNNNNNNNNNRGSLICGSSSVLSKGPLWGNYVFLKKT